MQSYFSYQCGENWVACGSPEWSFPAWQAALVKGPRIRPTGRQVVILQDPYPRRSGLIHLPEGAMDHADHWGTVLAVPQVAGRAGFWLPRVFLAQAAAREGEIERKGSFFYPISLIPGDRVLAIRFVGFDCLLEAYATDQSRLRLVDYFELYGVEDTADATAENAVGAC